MFMRYYASETLFIHTLHKIYEYIYILFVICRNQKYPKLDFWPTGFERDQFVFMIPTRHKEDGIHFWAPVATFHFKNKTSDFYAIGRNMNPAQWKRQLIPCFPPSRFFFFHDFSVNFFFQHARASTSLVCMNDLKHFWPVREKRDLFSVSHPSR